MKYDSVEREKVVRRRLSLHKEEVKKYEALKEKYPVEVGIKDGFYVIESKINKDELYRTKICTKHK